MAEKGQTGRSRLVLLLPLLLGGLNVWLNPHSPPWDAMELAEGEIRLEQLLNWEGDVIFVDARAPETTGRGICRRRSTYMRVTLMRWFWACWMFGRRKSP